MIFHPLVIYRSRLPDHNKKIQLPEVDIRKCLCKTEVDFWYGSEVIFYQNGSGLPIQK